MLEKWFRGDCGEMFDSGRFDNCVYAEIWENSLNKDQRDSEQVLKTCKTSEIYLKIENAHNYYGVANMLEHLQKLKA